MGICVWGYVGLRCSTGLRYIWLNWAGTECERERERVGEGGKERGIEYVWPSCIGLVRACKGKGKQREKEQEERERARREGHSRSEREEISCMGAGVCVYWREEESLVGMCERVRVCVWTH